MLDSTIAQRLTFEQLQERLEDHQFVKAYGAEMMAYLDRDETSMIQRLKTQYILLSYLIVYHTEKTFQPDYTADKKTVLIETARAMLEHYETKEPLVFSDVVLVYLHALLDWRVANGVA